MVKTLVALALAAGFLPATPGRAAPPPPSLDLVFLVDGSGSIDANDFSIQKTGITTALQDATSFPLDGSVSVSLIQWSSSSRVELDRTVLDSQESLDATIATIGAIVQLGGGTSPHLGINAYSSVLSEFDSGQQTLCLSTDGSPSSQSALASAASSAEGAGVDRLTVLAIEDPGAFTAANAQAYYGPVVFGDGTVVTTRNAAEFAQVVAGACIGDPVELVGLEVNQNIQTWTNSVALVASKPTIVRAHVQSRDGTPTRAIGRLYGDRNGSALPGSPLTPINNSVLAQDDAVALRGDIDASLNFALPQSWASGTVNLRIELIGGGVLCSEAAPPANTCAADVSFVTVNTPDVRLLKVPYTDASGAEQVVSSSDLDEQAERLKTVMPIPDLAYERRILNPDDPFVAETDPDDNKGFLGDVNESLLTARSNDGSNALYLGVLDGSVDGGGGGSAAGIGSNASSWFVSGSESREAYGYARNRGPHEFAHNVGEKHAGAADDVTLCSNNDKNKGAEYPFRDTVDGEEVPLLSELGDADTEAWGVDHRFVIDGSNDDLAVVDPNTTFALMGYCGSTDATSQGRWIDTDYQPRLIDTINGIDWSKGPDSDGGFWGWVRGIFDVETGDVEFKPFIGNEPGVVPTAMPDGDHRIELKDAEGNVLRSQSFEPAIFDSDAQAPFGVEAASVGIFVVPVKDPPLFASVDLIDPTGKVMGTMQASPNPPEVTVDTPIAGTVVTGDTIDVTWTSSDPDGDDLFHTVQYSSDGGVTWTTISVDSTGTSTSIPRATVAGSATAAVRVIASDGTRSAVDESEFFLVADNAPDVTILSPAEGARFSGVQSVLLRGTAHDQEDGQLQDTITWSSNLDGPFGSGSEVALLASDLSEGEHLITASVSDATGATTTASVSITVTRVAPPPDVPIVDCDTAIPTIEGTPGNDTIVGTDGDDVIFGYGGNDRISGGGGDDVICAGGGNDRVEAGDGSDHVAGGDGNDRLEGGNGDDTLLGGAGNDNVDGGDGDDSIVGGDGNDKLTAGSGDDTVVGDAGNDNVDGGDGDDTMSGGDGNDRCDGREGIDTADDTCENRQGIP